MISIYIILFKINVIRQTSCDFPIKNPDPGQLERRRKMVFPALSQKPGCTGDCSLAGFAQAYGEQPIDLCIQLFIRILCTAPGIDPEATF